MFHILRYFEINVTVSTQRERVVTDCPINAVIAVVIVNREAYVIEHDDIAIAGRSRTRRHARATGRRSGGLDGHVAIIERSRQNPRVDIDGVKNAI